MSGRPGESTGGAKTVWVSLTHATIVDSGTAAETSKELWAAKGWTGSAATGASAGTPGSWTPSGALPPANVAAIGAATASPSTAWKSGQYVQTDTPGAAGRAHWSGSAWVAGAVP